MPSAIKDDLVVWVRIALYMLAGRLTAGDFLPPEMVPQLVKEIATPQAAEAALGIILGAATTVWYFFSKARAALKQAASDLRETFR